MGPPRIPGVHLDAFNFTGGYPIREDLAPSIVFTILYLFCFPALVWRIGHKSSRTWLLLRPAIFTALRFTMYLMRAVMSVNTYGFDELRAENAIVSLSFMLLLFPLLDLWRRHVLTTVPRPNHPKWMRPIVVLCYVSLLSSIIVSIACALLLDAMVPLRGTDAEALWRSSYLLALGVVVLGLILVPATHYIFHLRPKGTKYLLALLVLCLITSVYRTTQLFTQNEDSPIRSRVAFYVLEGACDWVVLVSLLAVNLNHWFPGDRLREVEKELELQRHIKAMTKPAEEQRPRLWSV